MTRSRISAEYAFGIFPPPKIESMPIDSLIYPPLGILRFNRAGNCSRYDGNEKPAFAVRASAGSLRGVRLPRQPKPRWPRRLVEPRGVEPLTSSLRTRRSPN